MARRKKNSYKKTRQDVLEDLDAGYTHREIRERHGIAASTISRWKKEAAIASRTENRPTCSCGEEFATTTGLSKHLTKTGHHAAWPNRFRTTDAAAKETTAEAGILARSDTNADAAVSPATRPAPAVSRASSSAPLRYCPCCGVDLEKIRIALEMIR